MGEKKIKCPVCGMLMFEYEDSHDICEECYWEDEQLQAEDHDYIGGPNHMSLNQYKEEWEGRPEGLRGHDFYAYLEKKLGW